MRLSAAMACLIVCVVFGRAGLDGEQAGPPLPGLLDSYVTNHVKLTATQRSQLLSGQPITRLMETDASKEVAVFGAIWIDAPTARYIAAVKDIEQFEKGDNFRITKRISDPPRSRTSRC